MYDEQPPSCIHYSILWKVTLNGRTKLDDTEQDLVLAPSCYWERFLKPKLETVVAQKFTRAQRVRLDDTNITVSINDRSEDKLSGTFPKLSIDWSPIENQLLEWANLFVAGKKLKLIISFKYIGDSRRPPSKGDKRGMSSATERMQAELEGYLEAGRSAGLSDDWRHVYQLMRCRDKSSKGVHCLEDAASRKHYRLIPFIWIALSITSKVVGFSVLREISLNGSTSSSRRRINNRKPRQHLVPHLISYCQGRLLSRPRRQLPPIQHKWHCRLQSLLSAVLISRDPWTVPSETTASGMHPNGSMRRSRPITDMPAMWCWRMGFTWSRSIIVEI